MLRLHISGCTVDWCTLTQLVAHQKIFETTQSKYCILGISRCSLST